MPNLPLKQKPLAKPHFQQHSQRREKAPTRRYAADLHRLGRVMAGVMEIALL